MTVVVVSVLLSVVDGIVGVGGGDGTTFHS
jgi:hypothetical protein